MSHFELSGEPRLKGVSSIVEPSRAELAIARRAAETRATVPDLELSVQVEASAALETARVHGCSMTAVLVRACAGALRNHPRANAAYRDGRYELYSRVNVAVTVPTEEAYAAPTLLDADTKSLSRLDHELQRVRDRARSGELTNPELAGATFTLTHLDSSGVHRVGAMVTPPQAAALSVGAIRPVPVVHAGEVVPGQLMELTLACDSRILFSPAAASFIAAIAERLKAGASSP
jgi:pyruvate dehydrogenase E2 component (dihydrolipoamide acetyltransferase)